MIDWICGHYGCIVTTGVGFLLIAFGVRGLWYTVYGQRKSRPGNRIVK